jgi:ankyrin repeat protein
LSVVETLLSFGADIEDRSNDWKTPLLWAAYWGHINVVKYLVERGANVSAYDRTGMTVLMCAVFNGSEEAVRYLLSIEGVAVTKKNLYNGTALSIAHSKGYPLLVDLLKSHFPEDDDSPYLILGKIMADAAREAYSDLLVHAHSFENSLFQYHLTSTFHNWLCSHLQPICPLMVHPSTDSPIEHCVLHQLDLFLFSTFRAFLKFFS